ncbi:MAG: hypothetical protein WCP97_02415 [bacterium]
MFGINRGCKPPPLDQRVQRVKRWKSVTELASSMLFYRRESEVLRLLSLKLLRASLKAINQQEVHLLNQPQAETLTHALMIVGDEVTEMFLQQHLFLCKLLKLVPSKVGIEFIGLNTALATRALAESLKTKNRDGDSEN